MGVMMGCRRNWSYLCLRWYSGCQSLRLKTAFRTGQALERRRHGWTADEQPIGGVNKSIHKLIATGHD